MGFASSRLHAGVLRRALLVTAAASTCAAVAPAAAFAAPLLEAEKMTLPSNGRIVTDAGASGGAALRYPSNGTASKTVTVPATNAIVVRARGNQCGGAPRIVVKVSGTTVLDKLVSATTWTEYKVAKSYSASSRTVTAAYTNDYRSSTCDRGVEIDSIDFVGTTTTAPAPTPPLTGTAPAPTPTPTPTAPAPTPTAPAPTPTPTAPAPAPTGKIIKNLDFQTGDRNQWDSLQASPNRFSIVSGSTNPIPGYQYAARFFVKAGDPSVTPNSSDPRNELLWGGSSNLVFKEGDDRFFGFAAYFPNGTDGFGPNYPVPGTSTSGTDPIGHNSIIQWKQPGTGGPPIDFMIMNDAYKLGYSKPEIFKPFKRGLNRYVIRVVFSTSSTKGLVEVWHQGPGEVAMTKKSSTRIATIKSGTAGGYFKHGIYNSNRETKDAVFYSAGMKVGTTYDVVAPR